MQPNNTDAVQFGQIAERLRVRLDLANFKCKYGYENVDLYTIESLLLQYADRKNRHNHHHHRHHPQPQQNQHQHRYYPVRHRDANNKERQPDDYSKRTKLSATFKPTRSPMFLQSSPPLSSKRSTSPSGTDEMTAALLLWMYHQNSSSNTA